MGRLVTVLVAILLLPAVSAAADKMTRETFGSGGRTRTYYLLVPEAAKKVDSPPLVVLLHGSGRDGKSLVEKWEPLAKKEGIVIVGPDALSSDGWRVPEDGEASVESNAHRQERFGRRVVLACEIVQSHSAGKP